MNLEYTRALLDKLASLKLGATPEITDFLTEVWDDALDDVKPEYLALGVKHIAKNGTQSGFFPSAPELRKICLQFASGSQQGQLDKAWKQFKNYVPQLHGQGAKKQDDLLQADPALRRCIEAFHLDWSNATPESSSYWYKIFSESYLRAASGGLIEEGRKRLEGKQRDALSAIDECELAIGGQDDGS